MAGEHGMRHRSDRDSGREETALEETLREFEEAETEDDAAEPRRKRQWSGEAGDALSPNRGRQEDAGGE
ncbi:hypothetical protein [Streptomyces iconiensis]|uniref:Uncharacterized protein n=1 Tax=Streptomyces iconiensis TaxID=1384038 RepID=A0ABT7A6S8_9ACTN|nr:hypothetical protein [Streptomyces iconiensis]MDJ1136333.1 hypothetical protein [Streptomyces iconiensis]